MYKPHRKLHRLLACISIVSVRCDCDTTPVDGATPLSAGQSDTGGSTSTAASVPAMTTIDGDDSSSAATALGDTTGSAPGCGDGEKQGDEECDNGAGNGDDEACTDECTINVCGDGRTGPDEACDDGNLDNTDACTVACNAAACGDGFVHSSHEACDNGANNSDEGYCTSRCLNATCGDGLKSPGEQCDLGGENSDEGDCTSKCLNATCGDGFKGPGEECDLGGENSDEGSCTPECLNASCGDGFMGPGEECDLGGKNNDEGLCTSDCLEAACGDGFIGPGEQCDNGGVIIDNGCSKNCLYENAKVVQALDKHVKIEDNFYDGGQGSMACVDLLVKDNLGITGVQVVVGISHWNVHDLVIKLYNPDGKVIALMSRPGCDEVADVKGGCDALSSVAISGESPVWFRNAGVKDAEKMGDGLGGFEIVCKDDAECDYKPNPGKSLGAVDLVEFNGNQAEGTWKLCVGDAGEMYAGFLESVVLILWL